jgi:hypothetical protein
MADPATGFIANLLTGLAVYIAAAPSIGATWSPSAAYTSAQTAIVLGTLPANPDRLITLTAYDALDDPTAARSIIPVQIRTRWGTTDPRYVYNLDDALFVLLHNLSSVTLSTGVYVGQIHRNSGPAPPVQDQNQRWSLSSNYYVTCWRPGVNRL